ncbi:iron-sulfur cluster assembly protein IscA [Alkalilimnicola ehrlichii]|uniref:Iron-binding protein IscA n=1 Tax=Alkalilimnicola ehrlichii TaxID=351052 RepID=A0A3E0X122_9GAMM|nr:iron-sulfur cluster assembly accessory protein [Alkalilimnicola ehrlichii]RFA30544.1 iron-sulfur cluster assembly protein IscA [Alkalilimnicola ehrlichii]RFA38093.1 iron-sulfur cluster assembly protein IscA [Alkalilimnicola ehrlichii]
MAIQITDAAANHIRKTMAKKENAIGLRLGVKTSGCSGFAYTVDYADAVDPEDNVYEQHGVKLVVDKKSLPFLEGMEIDYIREGLNQRFEFRNPNVTASCGCGESFSV